MEIDAGEAGAAPVDCRWRGLRSLGPLPEIGAGGRPASFAIALPAANLCEARVGPKGPCKAPPKAKSLGRALGAALRGSPGGLGGYR